MTPQTTTTTEPINTHALRRRGSARAVELPDPAPGTPDVRPSSGWMVWVGIAAALVAAMWILLAGAAAESEAARQARADQATSARLQGLADRYELERQARANRAYSARLQGLADRYQPDRSDRIVTRHDPVVDRGVTAP